MIESEVRRIKREVEDDLLRRAGVTGVDVGPKLVGGKKTGMPAIRVYVERKGEYPSGEEIPKTVQGAQTDVVERRFVLH